MSEQRYVVDANVAIKLLLPDILTQKADVLFALREADPPVVFLVPDLFYVECANVLWKYVRLRNHPAALAKTICADVCALDVQAAPTFGLVGRAMDIGVAQGITVYDACYVALAERENATLVTADERLVRKFAGLKPTVQWLGDFEAPPGSRRRL